MFKILKKSKLSQARIGKLKTTNGVINTPFFIPIATRGTVKGLSTADMKNSGAQILLSNTYHLMLRPGEKLMKKYRGLHKFMNWQKPILTDSGGYQVFSLAKHRKITEKGAYFRDPQNGDDYFLSPEKAIDLQLIVGSDIIMVLDECPPYPCSEKYAKKSLELTARWAERSKKYFQKKIKNRKNPPLLFAIIQGSVYKDLRQESARQLVKLDFDGYAIGGVAVGEPRDKMKKVLGWALPELPQNKPRYLMGLGKPEEIVMAVKNGIDMFDCVIPTREARHGRLYVRAKSRKSKVEGLDSKFYKIVNITNSRFKNDLKSLDENCGCELCANYSKAYLHHLFKINDDLAKRLATIHNLKFYLDLMEELRQYIKKGEL
ncbi:tRNA guanosine(34) transglycosylase Tgt [Candidatus Parcubacteria bacterium]|nr:tRNA guanosine(34) transglycosylase Tgt [Candidatus Parcubacteria bacterium]